MNSTTVRGSIQLANVKVFADSPRYRPVSVELKFDPDPEVMITALTEFIYKNAKLMEFTDGKQEKNLWECIFKAVLNNQSTEHRIFKENLDKLIEANIQELGFDPRTQAIPEHIANQVANVIEDLEDEPEIVFKPAPKNDPHYWLKTYSILSKKSKFDRASAVKRANHAWGDEGLRQRHELYETRIEKLTDLKQ